MTRGTHVLPFASLSPADFERLCFGLVRREGYERAEHLGATGRDDGCDIVAIRGGRRVVFQCKRYEKLGPKDAEAVVAEILSLPEEDRPAELILLATCTVSPEARQRARQKAGAIDFQVWALTELDERVQRHPDLLAQFFDLPQRPTPQSPPSPSGVTAVPSPPPHYLPRPEALATLKARLLAADTTRLGITSPRKAVGVQGMGGIGKSVLAAALAQDAEVKAAFPDGVFWVAVGQQPDLIRFQVELTVAAGEPRPVLESPYQGKLLLSRLFAERKALLVLDDVWNLDHAAALNVLGLRGRLLITTRDAELLVGLGAEEFRVEVLDPEAALVLLADWAGQEVENLPQEAARVAHECGYLPLALAMIGAMVRLRPTAWTDALDRLARADLEKFRRNFPDYPYPDLLRTIEVSVEALEPAERERYLELAVFPEETAIPESTLETLWAAAGVPAADARDLSAKLVARSLAQRDSDEKLRLHDLQTDYLRHETGDLRRLHNRLVDAYAFRCPEGFAWGPNDGYFFEHLSSHLRDANRLAELRNLLLTYSWLEVKLAATDVNALLSDFDALPEDQELRLVQGALRLSADALLEAPEELAGQLHGRLLGKTEEGLIGLLSETHPSHLHHWLRPLTAGFTPPGGSLVQILHRQPDSIHALAVLPNCRVVTASNDCILRVYEIESGKIFQTLVGHSNWVNAVVAIPGSRIVSASSDCSLRVWDIESGKTLQTLIGHRAGVRAVAALPDGQVASAAENTIRVWDVASGKTLQILEGHSAGVRALAVLPNGCLVSASNDRTLRVWDINSGKTLRVLEGHEAGVSTVAVLSNGCIVSGADSTLLIWDLASEMPIRVLKGHTVGINAVTALPDGCFGSSSDDGTIQVWHATSDTPPQLLKGHSAPVRALGVLPDFRVVSASGDRTLRIWNIVSGKTLQKSESYAQQVHAVTVLPDGRIISADNSGLRVWDTASGKIFQILQSDGEAGRIRKVAALPDGRVASLSNDNLCVWDIASEKILIAIKTNYLTSCLAVLPNGHIVTAADGSLQIWDSDSGKSVTTLERGSFATINSVAVLPDGRVAFSENGRTLQIWDTTAGKTPQTLDGHSRWDRINILVRSSF